MIASSKAVRQTRSRATHFHEARLCSCFCMRRLAERKRGAGGAHLRSHGGITVVRSWLALTTPPVDDNSIELISNAGVEFNLYTCTSTALYWHTHQRPVLNTYALSVHFQSIQFGCKLSTRVDILKHLRFKFPAKKSNNVNVITWIMTTECIRCWEGRSVTINKRRTSQSITWLMRLPNQSLACC